MPRELFKTEPHGAQTVFVEDEDLPLHNQMFTIVSEDGRDNLVLTGEELLHLCSQFSDHVRNYRRQKMQPKGRTTQESCKADEAELRVLDSLLDKVQSSLSGQ